MNNAAKKFDQIALSDEEKSLLERMRKRSLKRTTLQRLTDAGRKLPLLVTFL